MYPTFDIITADQRPYKYLIVTFFFIAKLRLTNNTLANDPFSDHDYVLIFGRSADRLTIKSRFRSNNG